MDNLEIIEAHFRALPSVFPKRWSLFMARYRFLRELSGLEFHKLRGNTAKGYEISMKLGLAYSALETLKNALGKQLVPIRDVKAAKLLRSLRSTHFELFVIGSAKTPKLKQKLTDMFASQKSMDLTPLLEALRNAVFHGAFTPYSSNYTRSADVRILMDLVLHLTVDAIEFELERFANDLAN